MGKTPPHLKKFLFKKGHGKKAAGTKKAKPAFLKKKGK